MLLFLKKNIKLFIKNKYVNIPNKNKLRVLSLINICTLFNKPDLIIAVPKIFNTKIIIIKKKIHLLSFV